MLVGPNFEVLSSCGRKVPKIRADGKAKIPEFWIGPLSAYAGVLSALDGRRSHSTFSSFLSAKTVTVTRVAGRPSHKKEHVQTNMQSTVTNAGLPVVVVRG